MRFILLETCISRWDRTMAKQKAYHDKVLARYLPISFQDITFQDTQGSLEDYVIKGGLQNGKIVKVENNLLSIFPGLEFCSSQPSKASKRSFLKNQAQKRKKRLPWLFEYSQNSLQTVSIYKHERMTIPIMQRLQPSDSEIALMK